MGTRARSPMSFGKGAPGRGRVSMSLGESASALSFSVKSMLGVGIWEGGLVSKGI